MAYVIAPDDRASGFTVPMKVEAGLRAAMNAEASR
jgi:hypothetical protein